LTPDDEAELMQRQCLKRKLMPDDVARIVLFFVADDNGACCSPASIFPQASTALLYWRSHAVPLHAAGYDFDDCDLTSVGQAIKKPIKVRSKVALRFAGAKVSNAPIVVSAVMSYGKLRSVRHATVRNEYNVGSNRGGATTDTDIR
jgi:hypothetical protein